MERVFKEVMNLLITELGLSKFQSGALSIGIMLVAAILAVLGYLLLYKILKAVTRKLFRTLEKKKGHRIHLEFLERITNFGLVVFVVVSILGWNNLGESLLGSAAVITAVVGFAAQDVIKDILSGLLISIYRPFDLGDRIELEDGTVGIVESITMRHVVIVRIDTLRMVIPNSKINAASILNYSFGEVQRSCLFKFPVDYGSDIEKTKRVIYDAVVSSPYSIPGKKQKDGTMNYGNIYFIDLASSALVMAVTVYYEAGVAGERLKDDINTRVFQALLENGIEVPYDYTSVVIKQDSNQS